MATVRWYRTIRGPEEDAVIESRTTRQFGRFAPFALAISLIITPATAADDSKEAWAALVKGGHVALIRHGNAPPGRGGDPPGFKIADCGTQRNLDEMGREQAKALGEANPPKDGDAAGLKSRQSSTIIAC